MLECDVWKYSKGNKPMKKFIESIILSLILTFISVAVVFLLQAPLFSFVCYGFFSNTNQGLFLANLVNAMIDTDTTTIVILVIQVILTLSFVFIAFLFIRRVICLFLSKEKLIRVYYWGFFVITLILPVFLIYLSILLKVKLNILILVIACVGFILNTVLIFFTNKILPETTDDEYRKYLFSEGHRDE